MNVIRWVSCAVAVWAATVPASSQVRKLHTRDMTRLSQVQVADYLKRSDIIFIPIGAVETNGIMPSDRDYVSPLAYAMTMAEELDALYMPGLIWSYPGTTMIAEATVNISPSQGISFLRALAHSLLKQGFRRQVYISSGQGPAPLTVGTMVREFFDEEHVPILYIDMDTFLPKLKITAEARSKAGAADRPAGEGRLWGGGIPRGGSGSRERRPRRTREAGLFGQSEPGVVGPRRHGPRRRR